MTREEATIQALQGHIEALNETIEKQDKANKALEQESIIDKIRAEIDNALSDGMIHKKTVLGIIDKYKAESEET